MGAKRRGRPVKGYFSQRALALQAHVSLGTAHAYVNGTLLRPRQTTLHNLRQGETKLLLKQVREAKLDWLAHVGYDFYGDELTMDDYDEIARFWSRGW